MSFIESGLLRSSDPAEHSEIVRPWEAEFTQLEPGSFRGRIEFVRTERVTVYRERWSTRIFVPGTSPADSWIIGTTASSRITWCGGDLSQRRCAISRPGGAFEFWAAPGSDCVVAMIHPELFESFGAPDLLGNHLLCDERDGRRLVRALSAILAKHANHPGHPHDSDASSDLESEVLDVVNACADWGPGPGDDPSRRRQALRRALLFMRDHTQRLTVPQLAEAVGVSPRSLAYAFHEELKTTPSRFLRRHNMCGAHHELQQAGPDETTVSRVATKWGFTEFGRFAGTYRRMFGVLPSETLRRPVSPWRSLLAPRRKRQPTKGR